MQQGHGVARGARMGAKPARAQEGGDDSLVSGGSVTGSAGPGWAAVFVGVVGLQEEGMFRTIVGHF